jgi:hypothetical protein
VTLARTSLSVEMAAVARRIAGKAPGEIALEQARAAAEAEIELGRIRDVRRALIDWTATFGSLETPRYFRTDLREVRWLIAMEKWAAVEKDEDPNDPNRTISCQQCHKGNRNDPTRPCDACCPNRRNSLATNDVPGAGEIELSVDSRDRPKIALSLKRLRQILLNEPKLFLLVEIPTRHGPRRASRQR